MGNDQHSKARPDEPREALTMRQPPGSPVMPSRPRHLQEHAKRRGLPLGKEPHSGQGKPQGGQLVSKAPNRPGQRRTSGTQGAPTQAVGAAVKAANGKKTLSYWRFDVTLPFIYGEMIKNANSTTVKIIRSQTLVPHLYLSALALWAAQVRSGGPWDHKPQLIKMLGLKKGDFSFPIRGDEDHEYFYDIWSNIHYGYVGSAAGFGALVLQTGAASGPKALVGSNDLMDVLTVQLGIDLWNNYGIKLTRDQLHKEILSRRQDFLKAQETDEYKQANKEFRHVTPIVDGQ